MQAFTHFRGQPTMIDFDPDRMAGAAPSPCTSVCRMDPQSGLCEGCLRTIDEIVQWATASEEQKRSVWRAIVRRKDEVT
jgi:predicted Fe-S protein YdhL (DUF1289 family)